MGEAARHLRVVADDERAPVGLPGDLMQRPGAQLARFRSRCCKCREFIEPGQPILPDPMRPSRATWGHAGCMA